MPGFQMVIKNLDTLDSKPVVGRNHYKPCRLHNYWTVPKAYIPISLHTHNKYMSHCHHNVYIERFVRFALEYLHNVCSNS